MLIYVSGPYSGEDSKAIKENIKQAANMAGALWSMGHAVICPHTNTGEPYLSKKNCSADCDMYIEGDLNMISRCDALVMTKKWETSKGAKIEWDYANSLGIPIYYAPDYPPLHPTELRCPKQAKEKFQFLPIFTPCFSIYRRNRSEFSLPKKGKFGMTNESGEP